MTTATPAERKDRHLAMLAELGELAMDLARNAAAAAQDAIAQETDPAPHIASFTRLANTTRQLIALETRLASRAPANGHADADAAPPIHNPERARIGRIVRDNAKRAIDGPRLRDINRYLETRLDAPDVDEAITSTEPIGVIARTICQELSIPFDLAQQPDDVIKKRPAQPG